VRFSEGSQSLRTGPGWGSLSVAGYGPGPGVLFYEGVARLPDVDEKNLPGAKFSEQPR